MKIALTSVYVDSILRITRRFDASPARVFDAWLNPEIARKMFDSLAVALV